MIKLKKNIPRRPSIKVGSIVNLTKNVLTLKRESYKQFFEIIKQFSNELSIKIHNLCVKKSKQNNLKNGVN